MYNFISMPISNNNPNRSVQSLKAFVFHYTANYSAGANARANRNYFANHPNIQASANYCIDDHEVVECIKAKMVSWHAGGSYYTPYAKSHFMLNGAVRPNDFTIGFEMCVNSDGNWNTTVDNTIEFAARLAIQLGVPNIEIIRHYDVTTKNCPAMYVSNTEAWNNFKSRLRSRIAALQGKPVTAISNTSNSVIGSNIELQQILNKLNIKGIGGKVLDVDGIIGESSKFAIKTFQKNNGLGVDGIAGTQTWTALRKDVSTINSNVSKTSTNTSNTSDTKYGTVTAKSGLNVRKGAGTKYDVIGTLPYEAKVRLGNKVGDWWNIYYDKHGGFVSAEYIKI